MPLFYLDASALMKRYKTEQGSEVIDGLFEQRTADDRLATSFLVVIEIVGAAVRLRRGGTITEHQLSELLARFNEDQQHTLEFWPISPYIQGTAVRMAHNHGLRAADSLHLATMAELQKAAEVAGIGFLAITADKALYDAAQMEGIRVLNPEDADALIQSDE